MIELTNVCKSYPLNNGFRHVLRDVSLVIPDRTNVAVLLKAGVLVENEDRFFIPSADVLAGLTPVG